MSNRPNDFDDDDFRFDADDDDFRFDADDDVDFDGGLGDDFDADLPALDDDDTTDGESRGPSRTFILIAAVMIILFIVAIGALVFISRDTGPSPFELTSTAIANQNATVIAQGLETSTQSAVLLLTETQIAIESTLTAQAPTATPTPSPSPSPTVPPTIDPTQIAATQIALSTSQALTQQALPPQIATLDIGDIPPERLAQAATAVAAIFQTQIPGPFALPQGGGVQPDIAATSTLVAEFIQTQVAQLGEPIGPVAQAFTPVAEVLAAAAVVSGGNAPVVAVTATAVANALQTEIAAPVGNIPGPQVAQIATVVAQVLQGESQPQTGGSGGVLPLDVQLTSTAVAGGLAAEAQGPGGAIIGIVAQAATPAVGIFQTEIAFQGQVDPVAVQLTSTAVADLFGTALAGQGGGGEVSLPAVAQTATALAQILGQQPTLEQGGGAASPTAEGTTFGPRPTALPDTGLFDDIAGGTPGGLGGIVLAIVGLVGVIVISRRLRANNK